MARLKLVIFAWSLRPFAGAIHTFMSRYTTAGRPFRVQSSPASLYLSLSIGSHADEVATVSPILSASWRSRSTVACW